MSTLTTPKNRYYQTETLTVREHIWIGDAISGDPGESPCEEGYYYAAGTGYDGGGLIGGTQDGETVTVKFLWEKAELDSTITESNWVYGTIIHADNFIGATDGYLTLVSVESVGEDKIYTFTVNADFPTPHIDLYFAGYNKYITIAPGCYHIE